jgi:hypothetical protein
VAQKKQVKEEERHVDADQVCREPGKRKIGTARGAERKCEAE